MRPGNVKWVRSRALAPSSTAATRSTSAAAPSSSSARVPRSSKKRSRKGKIR